MMMKNKILFYLLLLINVDCQAQRFDGYVLAGISTSQISGDALSGFDKAGFMVGAGVVTSISKNNKTMMGMEIYNIQKGSRKPSRLDKGDPSFYRLRLNYLEIPLYLKYAASDHFQLFIGGAIGVLTGSSEENENGKVAYQVPFNKFDASATCGLEYLLTADWRMGLRLIQSVTPVRDFSGNAQTFFNNGQYNNVITFTVSYFFKSKRNNE